jgi:hypothetical protein
LRPGRLAAVAPGGAGQDAAHHQARLDQRVAGLLAVAGTDRREVAV